MVTGLHFHFHVLFFVFPTVFEFQKIFFLKKSLWYYKYTLPLVLLNFAFHEILIFTNFSLKRMLITQFCIADFISGLLVLIFLVFEIINFKAPRLESLSRYTYLYGNHMYPNNYLALSLNIFLEL